MRHFPHTTCVSDFTSQTHRMFHEISVSRHVVTCTLLSAQNLQWTLGNPEPLVVLTILANCSPVITIEITITLLLLLSCVGRDSSVGIATRYGLEGPGIESWLWRGFPRPSRTTLGPTQPSIHWVKEQGRDVDHPPHLAPR